MANTETGLKLLTIKVKGRHSNRNTDPNTVGFHGLTAQSVKRRHVGEVFEIPSTPYKKTENHYRRNADDFKRVLVTGDAREAMIEHFGWEGEQAEAYRRFQFFDPETMQLVEALKDVDEEDSKTLPNDFLSKLDEGKAFKEIRKQEDNPTLLAWLAVEKLGNPPREKIIKALEDAVRNK